MRRTPPNSWPALAAATVIATSGVARAHEIVGGDGTGAPRGPRNWAELWTTWGLEPLVLVSLGLSLFLYSRGVGRTWRAAGAANRGVKRWEVWCFAGGWLALFVALASPLHPLGGVLFSAHMTQHEVLMLVAAPLLALGRPLIAMLRALPAPVARSIGRATNSPAWRKSWHAVSNPVSAWLLHAVALWAWHIPSWFDATLRSELVHTLQHASFLGTALLFWWSIVHARRAAAAYGMAVVYLFTTAVHSGLLGVIITVSQTVLYAGYAHTTQSWGLTPLEDQQLGGLIMWIPAGVVYVVAGLSFIAGWLRESERRAKLRNASAYLTAARGVADPMAADQLEVMR